MLCLIAAGRRRVDIAAACRCSTSKVAARTQRMCEVLVADNREHLVALSAVYGLITHDHLPGIPGTRPHVPDDEQEVLDLVVAGWSETRIAARLQRDSATVQEVITRLALAFGAENRCQLAAHAVLLESVACHSVSPRFPPEPLSGLPAFHMTFMEVGVVLHHTPPQPSAGLTRRKPAVSFPADRDIAPAASSRRRTPARSQLDVAPIPRGLATWVRNRVGRHPAWALPTDSSGTRSWRMSTPEGIIELRVPRTYGVLHREVFARRHAIGRLDAARAPYLIGFDPILRVLLTREPRGERVDDTPGQGLHLTESVHEQAGQLLRVLHESAAGGTASWQAQAVGATLRYIDYVDRVLDRITSPVLAEHRTGIRHRLMSLRKGVPQLPGAFCHGSFGAGAWRWQRGTRSVALTGFTRSQPMAAVVDFARPSLLWTERPWLRDSFLQGYGRPLDGPERLLIGDFAVLTAVEDLWNATGQSQAGAETRLAEALSATADLMPSHEPDAGVVDRAQMPAG